MDNKIKITTNITREESLAILSNYQEIIKDPDMTYHELFDNCWDILSALHIDDIVKEIEDINFGMGGVGEGSGGDSGLNTPNDRERERVIDLSDFEKEEDKSDQEKFYEMRREEEREFLRHSTSPEEDEEEKEEKKKYYRDDNCER